MLNLTKLWREGMMMTPERKWWARNIYKILIFVSTSIIFITKCIACIANSIWWQFWALGNKYRLIEWSYNKQVIKLPYFRILFFDAYNFGFCEYISRNWILLFKENRAIGYDTNVRVVEKQKLARGWGGGRSVGLI